MVEYRVGGKQGKTVRLEVAPDRLALNIRGAPRYVTTGLSAQSRSVLSEMRREASFAHNRISVMKSVGVEVEAAITELKKDENVGFAGHLLVDSDSLQPVVYNEALFIAFRNDANESQINQLKSEYSNRINLVRQVKYARYAFIALPRSDMGRSLFDLSLELLEHDIVDRCHPEVLREKVTKAAFPLQWHLGTRTIDGTHISESANVEAAWAYSTGRSVKIAVIDDGVDMRHPEFVREGKIVSPFDTGSNTANANPRFTSDVHGTACAGVACASGLDGASGVAPDAALMPIRNASDLGSLAEADAIWWAVDHGADVISCSWGPSDGDWANPNDPLHTTRFDITDNTALAIEAAVNDGRSGRGCVVVWAAGNGNESVDLDGWASHAAVMAVAACSDRGVKSAYSDFGDAISCAFPSNDFVDPRPTKGIWTTDWRGSRGYNPGNAQEGDHAGNYTNSFGGTSSACPGVAGTAALLIGANLTLPGKEVRQAIEATADKIDAAGGNYDANGHSGKYGFGRVNAEAAVKSVVV